MRNKLGALSMALGILCILGALALLLHNQEEARQAAWAVEETLPRVRQAIRVGKEDQSAYEPPSPSEETVEESGGMTEVVIDGYAYIGELSIPALELELPILSSWSEEGMKLAPCRQFGTVGDGDLVIAGHNFTSHFGPIPRLGVGDAVCFTDMEGRRFLYEVASVETLAPTAVEQVKNSPWDLVLYTCTLSGGERVSVGCEKLRDESR